MRNYYDYETQRLLEDAKIANFRHLVVRAAHLALTNRALATAVLSLDTNAQRYADICSFLDKSALGSIESTSNLNLCEPEEGEDDGHEPEEWGGNPNAICSGRTAQGKPCTKRAAYSLAGAPFCRTHYPYPPEYYEAEERRREKWSQYAEQRKRLLDRYNELEHNIQALEAMNALLDAAIGKLGLTATRPDKIDVDGPMSVVRVDGLNFTLEQAQIGRTAAWWLRGRDGYRDALVQFWSEKQWRAIPLDPHTGGFRDVDYVGTREDVVRFAHLYQTFYRLRRERDLSWYANSVRKMVSEGIAITSPRPFQVLCGIEDAGSGWRIFHCEHRTGWIRDHSGVSEAAARWQYEHIRGAHPLAVMLVDPAHQIVEQTGGSRNLW